MNKKLSKELIAYIFAGVFTTGVNFAVYYLMIYINVDYKISNTVAFIVSIIFAFITNKKYVFYSEKNYLNEFIKFSAGRIFTYIFDIGMMVVLIEFLITGEYWAKIWTNIFVVVVNYFISKCWTFK